MLAPESLLQAKATTRALRTYAYLTSSIQAQKGTADALECLIPFVLAGVAEQADGEPLSEALLQDHLRSLGLSIPLFVLGQIKDRLTNLGVLEWSMATKRHIVRKARLQELAGAHQDNMLEDVFDEIEIKLGSFARSLGAATPHSATWSDALISFLKSETSLNVSETSKDGGQRGAAVDSSFKVRNTLMGKPEEAEHYIVASFIDHCKVQHDQSVINSIVQVYSGILIEEFISSVQTAGQVAGFKSLHIYYDTSLLLRLLGTSGHVLQNAVKEIHETLGQLGCRTFYLPSTRSEIKRILVGIAHGTANIHWETADALASGEVSEDTIRELAVTFETVLRSEFRIDPVKDLKTRGPQIDELGLSQAIFDEAKGRNYQFKTAESDARGVAAIVRLRQGYVTDGVSDCRHLFISRNPMLQRTARQFMMEDIHQDYEDETIPPVMTVGQIATVAWLSQPQKLEPAKLTRDLLSRCYNAVRPRPDWIRKYSEIVGKYAEKDPSFAQGISDNAMFVGTFTRLVRDATVGEPALLDRLDGANINQLVLEAERTTAEIRADLERTKSEADAAINARRLSEQEAADEKRRLEERVKHAEEAAQLAEERRSLAEAEASQSRLAAVAAEAARKISREETKVEVVDLEPDMHLRYAAFIVFVLILCATLGAYLLQGSRFAISLWLIFVIAVIPVIVGIFAVVYRGLSMEDFMQIFRAVMLSVTGRAGSSRRPSQTSLPGQSSLLPDGPSEDTRHRRARKSVTSRN